MCPKPASSAPSASLRRSPSRRSERSVSVEVSGSTLRAIASAGRADKKTATTLTEQFAKAKDAATRCAALVGAAYLEDAKAARALLEPALQAPEAAFRGAAACALALGSAEVTLLQQANAYRTLANLGRWSPVRLRKTDRAGEARGRTWIELGPLALPVVDRPRP